MTLTPQDIQTKQFHVRFRGFDVEEVDAFLERIAEEFLILIQENKQLQDRVELQEKDIEKYKEQEKRFQDAILSAHAIADEMKEKSKKESDEIIAGAKEVVEKMQNKAHEEITSLEATIVNLKELKDRVHDDVRHLLESYLDRLEEVTRGIAIDYVPEMEKKPLPPTPDPQISEEEAQELGLEASEEDKEEVIATGPTAEPEEPLIPQQENDEELHTEEMPHEATYPEIFSETGPKVEIEEDSDDDEHIIPDIDGEMLFTLEDPLDKLESDLTSPEKKDQDD